MIDLSDRVVLYGYGFDNEFAIEFCHYNSTHYNTPL